MKKVAIATTIATAVVFGSQAFAAENFDVHLQGVTEAVPAGALPPAGFYGINTTFYSPMTFYDNNGNKTSAGPFTKLYAMVEIPEVLWVAPFQVLGATYGMALAQPFDRAELSGGVSGATVAQGGMFNTQFQPVKLSWALPNHFHVQTSVNLSIPDGSFHNPANHVGGTLNSVGFFTVEPAVGVSYLNDGWDVSARMFYDHNFKNPTTDYTSGDMITVDYAVTKKFGKWQAGIGGYTSDQISNDTAPGGQAAGEPPIIDGNRQRKYAIGPVVGYNFGPVELQGMVNHILYAQNTPAGDEYWTRLFVPF